MRLPACGRARQSSGPRSASRIGRISPGIVFLGLVAASLLAIGDATAFSQTGPEDGLVVIAPAPELAPAAVTQGDQGLEGGWAVDESGNVQFFHSLSSRLPFMREAGAGWVRINFRLGACYPNWTSTGCNGRTALQAYDEVVANAQTQNLKILGLISNESWAGGQGQWTVNNAETAGGSGDNSYASGFAQGAASVLAAHFAGRINDWELWNEPNAWTSTDGAGHFFGGSYLYPSNYAWLLKRSYAAIKAVQPNATVILGGLFAHEPLGLLTSAYEDGSWKIVRKRADMPGARRPANPTSGLPILPAAACASSVPGGADSGASYLCATYAAGLSLAGWSPGAFPFDHIGQHPYLSVGTSASSSVMTSYLKDLRNAVLAYEGSGTQKRTHVTEFGWPTNQVSSNTQAENLSLAFQTFRSTSFVARAHWFNVQDAPYAGLYYGLVDSEGGHKPSFAAYQTYGTYGGSPPTQTISLHAGWNWFSINVQPSDPGIASVLSSISGRYDYVLGEAGTHAPAGPPQLNTLYILEPGRGYMIRMKEAATLAVSGTPVSPYTLISMASGWHWIGYLPVDTRSPGVALGSISGRYDYLLGEYGTHSPAGLTFLNSLAAMEPGRGYLVKMNVPAVLIYGP